MPQEYLQVSKTANEEVYSFFLDSAKKLNGDVQGIRHEASERFQFCPFPIVDEKEAKEMSEGLRKANQAGLCFVRMDFYLIDEGKISLAKKI